jgi:hypothetical protein
MESWAYLVKALDNAKEGDGTLLDRCLVYAHSDTHRADFHDLAGIPIMTAGRAGGRIKTGVHVDGQGGPGTRVGLTLMQAMSLPVDHWGVNAMETSQPVTAVVA